MKRRRVQRDPRTHPTFHRGRATGFQLWVGRVEAAGAGPQQRGWSRALQGCSCSPLQARVCLPAVPGALSAPVGWSKTNLSAVAGWVLLLLWF